MFQVQEKAQGLVCPARSRIIGWGAISLQVFGWVFLFCCCSAYAQAISGRVLDPQGASVPGARVGLYGRDSNSRASTLSDVEGRYRFDRVSSGQYIIEVEARGFSRINLSARPS